MDYNNLPNLDTPPEMRPYSATPRMGAGTHGKHGVARLHFELDGSGRSILRRIERRAPLIVQQELYFDEMMPQMPCVYILSAGGPNVDGDRYEQHFSLGEGSYAHISTGAATKLAEMQHNYSAMQQSFHLAAESYLEYLPEPIIPCRHARFLSETTIYIDASATLFYSEILHCGRQYHMGEVFDYDLLSMKVSAFRPDNRQLFCEKLIIEPHRQHPATIGTMADYKIMGTALVFSSPDNCRALYQNSPTKIDLQNRTAAGALLLEGDCGVEYRVLGHGTMAVKHLIREFCSQVRTLVKGRPLPNEFAWR